MRKQLVIFLIYCNMASCQLYSPGFDYKIFDNSPVEKLARAVQRDDIEEIKRLITEQKIDLNYQEEKFGNTVLSLAVINQKTETVEVLLRLGANPNIVGGRQSRTPFINSLQYTYRRSSCDTSKIKLLIDYNADIHSVYHDKLNGIKETPLMIASRNGCIEVVKLLLEKGVDINRYTNFEGYGAITVALIHNNVDIAKYLIIDLKAKIPDFVFKRFYGNAKNDPPIKYMTITDILMEMNYINDPEMQKAKEEILSYLKSIGKK